MATLPNARMKQDMPPKGGYPEINFKRGARPRGPSGALIWGAVLGATAFGFYQISVTNAEKRMCRKEQREGRMAIMPFLMAESDAMSSEKYKKALEYESKIMKDVPGWKVGASVMSDGAKWQRPTHGISS